MAYFFLFQTVKNLLLLSCSLLLLSSCIVQSPKYAMLDQAMGVYPGMSKDSVEELLGVEPYNVKSRTDTSDVYIYVYRVMDRRTLSFNTKPTNGKKAKGKHMQLAVAYSKNEKVTGVESCIDCPDDLVKVSRVSVEKVIAFATLTLPAILVYFGLQEENK